MGVGSFLYKEPMEEAAKVAQREVMVAGIGMVAVRMERNMVMSPLCPSLNHLGKPPLACWS